MCYESSRHPELTVVSFLWDFFSAGFPCVSWESASNSVWQQQQQQRVGGGAADDAGAASTVRFPPPNSVGHSSHG